MKCRMNIGGFMKFVGQCFERNVERNVESFGVCKPVSVLPREWNGQKYWRDSWKRIRDCDNRERGGKKFLG